MSLASFGAMFLTRNPWVTAVVAHRFRTLNHLCLNRNTCFSVIPVSALAVHRNGVCGDDLMNHPVSITLVSKLNGLCRMTLDRESDTQGLFPSLE